LSVDSIPTYRYKSALRGDSGAPGWISAECRLETDLELAGYLGQGPALGDPVGLVEDNRGSDLHNHRVCSWLHSVVAQFLLFTVDQDGNDAALY